MESVRRTYLTKPGAGLLVTTDILEFASAVTQFIEDTELPPEAIVATPVVSVPIPRPMNSDGQLAVNLTHPEMIWHPLFWLPADVAAHRLIEEEDGEERTESDTEWAVRVVTSCERAGGQWSTPTVQ